MKEYLMDTEDDLTDVYRRERVTCSVPFRGTATFSVDPEEFRGSDLNGIMLALRGMAEAESGCVVPSADVEADAHLILDTLNEVG